jgi:hypothetical protein
MENIGKSNEQPKESANRNVDDQFANARKPLNQRLPFLCTHQGDCLDSTLIVEKGANAQAHVHESFLDVTAAVSVRNVPVLACRWDLSV